jgi:predicted Holliday junction resolvase-like endonuclease
MEFFILILVIVVIVLLVKLSGLRGEMASRAHSVALTMLERWKAVELRKQVAREVELSIASIKEKAENDVKLAKQELALNSKNGKPTKPFASVRVQPRKAAPSMSAKLPNI